MSYEYWAKFVNKYLPRRKSIDEDVKVKEKLSEKKKDKSKTTEKVKPSSSVLSKGAVVVCILAVIIPAFVYFVPWEKWVFSEDELDRLLETEELEYRDFMATADQHFSQISIHEVDCINKAYKREISLDAGPARCGTMITDELLPKDQITNLRNLCKKVIEKVGDTSYGNRESINLQWINLHNLFRRNLKKKVLRKSEFELIRNASEAAREAVSTAFGIPTNKLYFNLVSQFTRYRPLVKFSEFKHVDKVRSPGLVITSILWLSTCNLDFGGGHLEFLTGPGPEPYSPLLLEPKVGRFAAWTSGFENPHGVNELYWGNRMALIFAFTVSDKIGHKDIDALRSWALNSTTQASY